jgi:hypothetical protein
MKKNMVLMVILSLLVYGCQAEVKSETTNKNKIIVVLPLLQPAEMLEEARRFILHILFEVMEGGDTLAVIEAGSRNEIAFFAYPEVELKTTRLKEKYVKKEWERFLGCQKKTADTSDLDANLSIPLFCRWLQDRLAIERGKRTSVLFLGSPIHRDPDPRYSFQKDDWFSDAVFVHDTPFHVADGSRDRLKDISFHFVYFHSPFLDLKHQDQIHRFWSLYLSLQGGNLVTFSSDRKAFQRIKADITPVRHELDPEDCRLVARHSVTAKGLDIHLSALQSEKLVVSMCYENKSSDVDLVAVLNGKRLDFRTTADFGVHKKHLVSGCEEIHTSYLPQMIVKIEHVNGPPPGEVVLSVFTEDGQRLAGREYEGFDRFTSYNLQKQEASFKISDLLNGNTADFGIGG